MKISSFFGTISPMTQTTEIHGHKVEYEDNAREGIIYLKEKLESAESQIFFNQAKAHHSADFEDNHNHNFTLLHHADGYTLVRR